MTAAPLQEATLASDTWDVPGPLVLGGYAVLALVTAYAVVTAPDRDERRRTGDDLRPHLRPSWPTYGPDAAGMSVALFGVTALAPTVARAVDACELFDLDTGETSSTGGCGG